ncbi:hypothetical protein ACLM5H_12225 [Fredinandcohnia humi]
MMHFSSKEWELYVNDKLIESKREELENHLLSCDQCLEIYMKVINTQLEDLPDIQNNSFTEETITKLPPKKQKRKNSFLQSPIFHYGVAAVITFTLMTSGFFQSISGIVTTVEASSMTKQEKSVSHNLMEKALSIFDMMDDKQKEAN